MLSKKDIALQATRFAQFKHLSSAERNYYEEGFKKGAQYVLSSLWHNADEIPNDNEGTESIECLVYYKDGYINIESYNNWYHHWETKSSDFTKLITGWIYIEDLLSNINI